MSATKWSDPTDRPNAERWHGDLIALDPSVNSPGAALFRHGILVAAERVRIPSGVSALPRGERYLRVAMHIAAWWRDSLEGHSHVVRTVVYEHPQIYSEIKGKSKGDPNKLLGLVGVAQSFVTLMVSHNLTIGARPPEIVDFDPDEWTAQVPKTVGGKLPKEAWSSPRGERIKARLEPGEFAIIPEQHDVIDSVGVGMQALGRGFVGKTRGRTFSGAV